jgi:hypothetical protein
MANEGAIYGESPPGFYANRWRWPDFDLGMGALAAFGSDSYKSREHSGVEKDFPRALPVRTAGPVVMPPSPPWSLIKPAMRDKKAPVQDRRSKK